MNSSKTVDHLGLVSGMIDELGLVEMLDTLLQTDGIERDVSLGILIKALILNGLGFSQRTLYMVSDFFTDKPVELLLGPGIKASQLNDTVLGRCLDTIYKAGCTSVYANLAPQICQKLGLKPKFGHMDSTDFHVDGVYNSRMPLEANAEVAEGEAAELKAIRLTKGYSRDHRPDLNQVVLNMIVENQAGIPLHMQAFDGNMSDKTAFNQTIRDHVAQLQSVTDIEYLVMDSAGYTKKSLEACQNTIKWISRVPETLSESKIVIEKDYDTWNELPNGYKYVPLTSEYGGVKQRWLLVFSKEAYEREIITLKKKIVKESEKELRDFLKLCNTAFNCKVDAQKTINSFKKKCKYLSFNILDMKEVPVFEKKGRPKKDAKPKSFQYYVQGEVFLDTDTFKKLAKHKGRFIVATNELDEDKLPNDELFSGYKGQSKVEKGFRFLKDPQFMASTIFLKKPERVEAILFIMTLSLTVYAALEYRIRQKLKEDNETIPNQLGKPVKNPTARWVFQIFSNVQLLYDNDRQAILNLTPIKTKIINLLGPHYQKYYFLI
jgi:transposase